jgi:hypothetical protein
MDRLTKERFWSYVNKKAFFCNSEGEWARVKCLEASNEIPG